MVALLADAPPFGAFLILGLVAAGEAVHSVTTPMVVARLVVAPTVARLKVGHQKVGAVLQIDCRRPCCRFVVMMVVTAVVTVVVTAAVFG